MSYCFPPLLFHSPLLLMLFNLLANVSINFIIILWSLLLKKISLNRNTHLHFLLILDH